MNIFLTLAAFVVVAAGLKAAAAVVNLFLLAFFLSIIISPLIFWLERRKIPRGVALTLTLLVLLGITSFLVTLVGGSLTSLARALPFYVERLSGQFADLSAWLGSMGLPTLEGDMGGLISPTAALSVAGTFIAGISDLVANGLLVLLTMVFILLEISSFPQKVRKIARDPAFSAVQYEQTIATIQRYMGLKTLICLVKGGSVFIALLILKVDYAIIWGLLAFLMTYIPNIGSLLAGIPPVALAWVQHGPGVAVAVALVYIVLNNLVGNVLEPRIMGKGLGLSTLVVFVSMVFWGWLLGPVGLVLSAPLTGIVRIVMDSSPDTRWLAVLLAPGDDSAE
jgi:predicted PurR-regulated permease PerM